MNSRLQRARALNRGLLTLVSQYLPQSRPLARNHNDWAVVGPALVARAARTMKAIDELQNGYFAGAADALVRVVYDHMNTFAWIAAEPASRLPCWIAEDYRKRLVVQDELEALGGQPMPSNIRLEFEQHRDAATVRLPNTERLAGQADDHWGKVLGEVFNHAPVFTFRGMYTAIFRNASAWVHPTTIGLNGMVTTDPMYGQLVIDSDGERFESEGTNAFTVAP
ncbi:MAG: hypothetical protein RJA70_263, partial [Pseudomonadota bacterium]